MDNKIRTYIIESSILQGLLRFLPDKYFIIFTYFVLNSSVPDFKNPKKLTEKIQWIKANVDLRKYAQYVDKYEVRDYIKKTIGEKYLIPIYGIWDKFEDVPFDKLPNKFVIKATHSSGFNFICPDKSKLDREALRKIVEGWMQGNYYNQFREIQYKEIKPRIICEEYLEEPEGLTDYKFFCSNGKPVFIEVFTDRFTTPSLDLFDLNWRRLPIFFQFQNSKKEIKKPNKFEEMVEVSKKLSKIFPFVRVDLYLHKNKIYFGELTFTPGSGFHLVKPRKADYTLGELIDLSGFK